MSAVREAIQAVVDRYAEANLTPAGMHPDLLVTLLTEAVEAVPVKVTIRDLDMEPENILTFDGESLMPIAITVIGAHETGQPLHWAVDAGACKFKIGNGSWSPPLYPEDEVYAG